MLANSHKESSNKELYSGVEFSTWLDLEALFPEEKYLIENYVYLQQIICLIEKERDRLQALEEAYRILKPGGTGLFSFLSFESRSSKLTYSSYLAYLKTIRKLRGDELSIQYLPWMKLGGKLNIDAILDRSPYTYWYRIAEIYNLLTSVGFEILAIGTDPQLSADNLKANARELLTEEISGMLYVVVNKQ